MNLTNLNAISPVDGRYRKATESLAYYFSEAAFINYRIFVEIEYFIALCEIPLPQLGKFDKSNYDALQKISRNFTFRDAEEVKKIEKTTNHDVKAVEYYLKKQFEKMGLSEYREFIHFGLTSQDVNNTSVPYALKLGFNDVLLKYYEELINKLSQLAREWAKVPMLARTHGQPASPTTLGKEIYVFVDRLKKQLKLLKAVPFTAKFGGATGNFNAHKIAYPDIDWVDFGNKFLKERLNLSRQQVTTQIEHYDDMAALFDGMKRINTILLDLSRDMWTYISMEYFRQKIKKGEVGSSTMPHKVNPIDFENAEGNIGVANALFEHLSAKLPISRLQRDLTDSTVSRNIGVPVGHTIIAIKSITKGLDKLLINRDKIKEDLDNNWAVLGEAIQTILRREKYPNPYETLKKLTRNNTRITEEKLHDFINKLNVDEKVKEELRNLRPDTYTGITKF